MKKLDNNGFSPVEVAMVIVIVGLLGLCGWLFYSRQHKTATPPAQTSTTQATKTTTTAPASNQKYLTISQWSVRMPYDGSSQFTYNIVTSTDKIQRVDYVTPEVSALGELCAKGGYSGSIVRYAPTAVPDPAPTKETVEQLAKQTPEYYKHIGNYYYSFDSPHAACEDKPTAAGQALVHKTSDELKALFAKLEAVPANQ